MEGNIMNLNNKNILVTGGTGLIGRELVELLINTKKPKSIRIVSLDDKARSHPDCEFIQMDLRKEDNCIKAVKDMDIVMHLMGNKGSPKMASERPSDMFVSHLLCNTNMMEAAFKEDVEWYLFTSSVGVYSPSPVMTEDDVWKTFPSKHDWYPGWAKRMGELQAETYAIQYGWKKTSIVRPANVYGRYDNYDPANAMVIPSLIRRIIDGENPLVVWGDGTPVRDFIHAKDCARGMIHMIEKEVNDVVNLGSGTGVSIRQLAELLVRISEEKPEIIWDTSKPNGDASRLLDTKRMNSVGFFNEISFENGLQEVYNFYKDVNNRNLVSKRYSVFSESEGKQ
jgi:GDP-L-fucose synthase